ncbi:MAG: electron transfer flavoprotein subunit alpha/FixB family protein [Sediminibacterium sp.]|jgi:electron transfer flavoprotein alpha subunit|nr:electron transfer flavoprotein subunit alpha/FixB family protein [Sediminibacterium sp.]
MSVLVFIDQSEGHIKKNALEAATYGNHLAQQMGVDANAVVLGNVQDDLTTLGQYGIKNVFQVADSALSSLDAQQYVAAINAAVEQANASVVVFSHNQTGKAIAARVAAKLKAGLVAGASALPVLNDGFVVKKSVFSGKAFAHVKVTSEKKVISINPNSYKIEANGSATANVVAVSVSLPSARVVVTNVEKVSGDVPLTEAEVVVSGGRGLKGPENWGILLDLAQVLGAATACSRPVGDAHWRPHHEHVGQTGVQIAPNLYIAIGISGAIQHLAGVNRSKVIVVINKDPEAPFFKAADYGIVGDAFDVVPKLTAAIKKLKGVA